MSGWQWFIHTADKAQKRQSRAFEEVNEIKKKVSLKKSGNKRMDVRLRSRSTSFHRLSRLGSKTNDDFYLKILVASSFLIGLIDSRHY